MKILFEKNSEQNFPNLLDKKRHTIPGNAESPKQNNHHPPAKSRNNTHDN